MLSIFDGTREEDLLLVLLEFTHADRMRVHPIVK